MEAFGRLPLRFERIEGRATEQPSYLARGTGYTVFVLPAEMVLWLRSANGRTAVLRVRLLGARSPVEIEGLDELPGSSNYFIGGDPKRWRKNVPGHAKVRCRGVYPGIDVVYYGRQGKLEFDFVVQPGSDPDRIRLGFEGARGLRLDHERSLLVLAEGGEVKLHTPRVYQNVGWKESTVPGRWVLSGADEARFEVGAYDRGSIAVDGSGSVYVTGWTDSIDFPMQYPYQADQASADVFVTKMSPAGDSLVYSTYIGGTGPDHGYGIAVDGSGSAYVTGDTGSTDFPTQDPYQVDQGLYDAFVAKLSPLGNALVYSTYLGGTSGDWGSAIAVDGSGSAYVTGSTGSTDFPTQNPYQASPAGALDVFVAKLLPSGDGLVYSTYLGGSGSDYGAAIAVDGSESAYVTGNTSSTDFPTQNPYQTDQALDDAFVTRLSPSGNSLAFSTYLGGSSGDFGYGMAVDGSGSAYIVGETFSTDFPTRNPYQPYRGQGDVFVTKLWPPGDGLQYSTYLGGGDGDRGSAIAVDDSGSAHLTGVTFSADFPTENPYQLYQGISDAFVARLSPSGDDLAYSTYLGGLSFEFGNGIAVDGSGSTYVIGTTYSTGFPTQNPFQTDPALGVDAFVTKIGPPPPTGFFTVPPCRALDTRNGPGPYGAPALGAGGARPFTLAGRCGVSSKARAVAVTIAVTQPNAAGHLRLYPAGAAVPQTASINYGAGQTRASNAIVLLTSGGITVRCAQATGSVHFILDVTGYFE